jgi:hypothetical protein
MISFGQHFSRPDGTFSLEVYSGRRYQVAAVALNGPPLIETLRNPGLKLLGLGESHAFKLSASAPLLEIRLERPQDMEKKRLLEKYIGESATMTDIFNAAF